MSTARHQLAGAPGTGTTIDNMKSRCIAWSRVNQAGTQGHSGASFNTSSIGDGGNGITNINLTATMANTGSSMAGSAMNIGVAHGAMAMNGISSSAYNFACYIAWGTAASDVNAANSALFGDLA